MFFSPWGKKRLLVSDCVLTKCTSVDSVPNKMAVSVSTWYVFLISNPANEFIFNSYNSTNTAESLTVKWLVYTRNSHYFTFLFLSSVHFVWSALCECLGEKQTTTMDTWLDAGPHKHLYIVFCFIQRVNTIWVRGGQNFLCCQFISCTFIHMIPITPNHPLRR